MHTGSKPRKIFDSGPVGKSSLTAQDVAEGVSLRLAFWGEETHSETRVVSHETFAEAFGHLPKGPQPTEVELEANGGKVTLSCRHPDGMALVFPGSTLYHACGTMANGQPKSGDCSTPRCPMARLLLFHLTIAEQPPQAAASP